MADQSTNQSGQSAALATLGIGAFGSGFLVGFAAMFVLSAVLTNDDKKRKRS